MSSPDASAVGAWMTRVPVVVAAEVPLEEVEALMSEHGVRHLPVTSGGRVVGVISERDVSQVRALSCRPDSPIAAVEAMTPAPYAVRADAPLARVATSMARERYGCALVTGESEDDVLGIFTTMDALRALAALLR